MKNWSTTKKVLVGILILILIAAAIYQFTSVFGNEKGFFGERASNGSTEKKNVGCAGTIYNRDGGAVPGSGYVTYNGIASNSERCP